MSEHSAEVSDPKSPDKGKPACLLEIAIGLVLFCLREQMGLTQEEVAARASCCTSCLSAVENGQAHLRLNLLEGLCLALPVPPASVVKLARLLSTAYLKAHANLAGDPGVIPDSPSAQHWLREYLRTNSLLAENAPLRGQLSFSRDLRFARQRPRLSPAPGCVPPASVPQPSDRPEPAADWRIPGDKPSLLRG